MATHKLAPYWVSVRQFREPNDKWDLTNLQQHEPRFPNNNLTDYFWDFLDEIENGFKINEEDDKTFAVESPIERQGNTIEGRFKSGEWGNEQDVADIKEREQFESALKDHHAPQVPFYFFFHIPDQDPSRALLLLSRYKKKGVKGLFENYFLPRNRSIKVGDAYIEINRHFSRDILEKLNDVDEVASIKFRGEKALPAHAEYSAQKNLENFGSSFSGVLEVDVHQQIKPKGNFEAFREFVKDISNYDVNRKGNNTHEFEYGEIDPSQYDSASVTVKEGETPLTFSLWEEKILVLAHIDHDEYDLSVQGGFPTPHTIGSAARRVANDILPDRCSELQTTSLISREVGSTTTTESSVPSQDE